VQAIIPDLETLVIKEISAINLIESSSTMRQGSLQPQKENSKAPSANSSVKLNSTAKARLRSQSPGNSTMTLSYFQEMLNKPKWKY
jgi:hypothetical protein